MFTICRARAMNQRNIPFVVSHEYPGSEIDGDTLEFLQAIEAYQRRYARRYPAWSEILYVLRLLGYAKVVPGAKFPIPQTEPVEAT
jgi:hypothetical protein